MSEQARQSSAAAWLSGLSNGDRSEEGQSAAGSWDAGQGAGQPLLSAVLICCLLSHTWTSRCDTWLLIKLMPKDVVSSFLFFLFQSCLVIAWCYDMH